MGPLCGRGEFFDEALEIDSRGELELAHRAKGSQPIRVDLILAAMGGHQHQRTG